MQSLEHNICAILLIEFSDDFVDKFQQQNSAMKFSQQCLLLVSNMNDFAKHGKYIFYNC